MSDRSRVEGIHWLGHASFRLWGSVSLYVDPWKLESSPRDGEIILVTHNHYDHFSPEDIERCAAEGAAVVVPAAMANSVKWPRVIPLEPGASIELEGVTIDTVPAYNLTKHFHPRSERWLGYVVNLDGRRIYHAGDTDLIEEMRNIVCDVALLPVSGTYVMTAEEAVVASRRLHCDLFVPMHFGDIIGDMSDAQRFRKNAAGEVVILEQTG